MVDFEPIYTISPAEAVARFLAERYALAAPFQCQMVRRGFNDTYRIVTASDERYIFRLSHHRARGAADVGTETDFLVHLARSGVPVAAAVRTLDGALFVRAQAREGQREGVLFHELQGRAPEATSLADARANGVTLAKLHNAADSYSAPAPLYRLDLDHLLRWPLARIRNSGLMEGAIAEAADIEAIATRTTERIEAYSDLKWTHCHGDCHGSNACITETGEAAFFDFDDSGPGYLAYDISVFLWSKVSFGRKFHAVWHAFVDGYRSARPITQSDFEAAHAFVIIRHFWLMGEYASRTREWGTELTKWVAREGEFLKSWEREHLDGRLRL